MGLSPADFWNMELREFYNASEGYNRRIQGEWTRVRWLATIYANFNGISPRKLQPQDIMKFPWEGEIDRSEEIKKIQEYKKKWRVQ